MKASVVIATYGSDEWAEAAWTFAYPSAAAQASEVIVRHEPDGTLASSRNRAAEDATGSHLVFLDADDQLAPGYVDAMTQAARGVSERPPLFAPYVQYVRGGGSDVGEPHLPNQGRWPDLNVAVIGTMIHRGQFLALGGFRDLASLEDWDLWLRAVKDGSALIVVAQAVYRATARDDGRNRDQSIYHQLRQEHAEVWAAAR